MNELFDTFVGPVSAITMKTKILVGDSISGQYGHLVSHGEPVTVEVAKAFGEGKYVEIGDRLIYENGEVKARD